eukprot:8315356-Pyramimonas_sp.AAC.1
MDGEFDCMFVDEDAADSFCENHNGDERAIVEALWGHGQATQNVASLMIMMFRTRAPVPTCVIMAGEDI